MSGRSSLRTYWELGVCVGLLQVRVKEVEVVEKLDEIGAEHRQHLLVAVLDHEVHQVSSVKLKHHLPLH
jgi:hypothetical protein